MTGNPLGIEHPRILRSPSVHITLKELPKLKVGDKLIQRIDSGVIELKAQMSVDMTKVLDQLTLRTGSDRFIKVGFGVAVLGVLIQTVFVALK